ncbi:DNA-processing protein DprA [Brachybacterium sp. GPGPB12]|uniref:DNA-processing protein DprA n=1 Tax=Brachybacterium sp. GPGPB12 TaxID=3023517 RepID=UPI0031344300
MREQDLLLSEAPMGTAPTRWRFLARNRLIAALSRAVVVVEAAWRSGALSTARLADQLSRPVGAVPGPVTSAASAGRHRLIRERGAVLVTEPAESLDLPPGGPAAGRGASPARTSSICSHQRIGVCSMPCRPARASPRTASRTRSASRRARSAQRWPGSSRWA